MSTPPLNFRRGGVRYQLTASAFESSTFESVSVTISRSVNPAGVRSASQSHTYTFGSLEGVFDHAANLSTASISTGDRLGKWGKLNLSFRQNAATKTSCGGDRKTRSGTISGSLELKTGTERFGTITNDPSRGTLSVQGECGFGNNNPCLPPSRAVSGFKGHRNTGVNSFRANGASSASISFFWSDPLDDGNTSFRLQHFSSARVPARKVNVADNLGSATVRGAKGTWITGEATFRSNAAADTSASPCGNGKESVATRRPGTIGGTLRVTSFLGKNVNADNTTGSATKYAVRAQ